MFNLARQTDSANVRGSEGSGTTTLASSDNKWQIFNLSAARTTLLPSAGIKAGDTIRLENRGTGKLTVQASDATNISFVDSLYTTVIVVALQDAPTTSTHWKLRFTYTEAIYQHGTSYNGGNAPTISLSSGGGSINSVNFSYFIPRQLQDGTWILSVSFYVQLTSATRTNARFAVNGLSVVNNQTFSGTQFDNSAILMSLSQIDTNTFSIAHQSGTINNYSVGCSSLVLNSKPTWAY